MPASPLTTQCPACQQLLDVTLHQLAQARGRAVCEHCQASFDALARLALHASGPFGPRQAYPVSNELPLLSASPAFKPTASAPAGSSANTDGSPSPASSAPRLLHPAGSAEQPVDTFVPDFGRRRPAIARRAGMAAAALLILAGGGWILRKPLARLPVTGQGMAWVCSHSGCQLPTMADRQRLQLLARDVRANPQHPGQLAINLSLRNTAWFAQPYPIVIVTLQGPSGQALATQRFRPDAYLGPHSAMDSSMAAGAELTISLQMTDPGSAANGFTLHFQ